MRECAHAWIARKSARQKGAKEVSARREARARGVCERSLNGGFRGGRVLPAEAIDAAGDIDDLVFARVEGVAGGTDVGGETAARGARLDDVAAGTGDGCVFVIGVDAGFHDVFSRCGFDV